MKENHRGLVQPETKDNECLQQLILRKAGTLIRSRQNPPESPGVQFLRPREKGFFEELDARFAQLLSEFRLNKRNGITIDGIPLHFAVLDHKRDPVAEDAESAKGRGFWAGVQEALEWMGVTGPKWSKQSFDICALEALAAAEGIPTSRQINHTRPNTLVGARCKRKEEGNSFSFDYGVTNGIYRDGNGQPAFLQLGNSNVIKELTDGYRKGVEVAFLHYIAIGPKYSPWFG